MKLKWEKDDSIKTGIGRARGLGPVGEGSTTWLRERISGAVAIPVCLWLAFSVKNMPGWSHDDFTAWLAEPVNAVLMILSVLFLFYHAALGCKVIVEDYVHNEGFKVVKLAGIDLFFFAAGVASIFSVLKIALGGV